MASTRREASVTPSSLMRLFSTRRPVKLADAQGRLQSRATAGRAEFVNQWIEKCKDLASDISSIGRFYGVD